MDKSSIKFAIQLLRLNIVFSYPLRGHGPTGIEIKINTYKTGILLSQARTKDKVQRQKLEKL